MHAVFLPVIITLLLAFPVFASNANIECIQNQLNEVGYDAGPADGLNGRRTKQALKRFLRENALGETMPLVEATASATCRRIGMAKPALKKFWPSRDATVEVVVGEGVRPPVARVTEMFARSIHQDTLERFGVEIAGTDFIVIGANPAELQALISKQTSFKIMGLPDRLKQVCGSKRNMSGAAVPNLVYVCVNPDATLGSGIALDWVQFFLAHEITHLIQFQVNGTLPVVGFNESQRLDFEGPLWLVEGLAQVVANTTATSEHESVYRDIMLSRYEGRQVPDLAELEDRQAFEQRTTDVYRTGTIAATDLVLEHGYRVFGELYGDLANGIPWATAFEARFGQDQQSFYQQFNMRYRK